MPSRNNTIARTLLATLLAIAPATSASAGKVEPMHPRAAALRLPPEPADPGEPAGRSIEFRLTFDRPVTVDTETDGRELVLRFDAPLDAAQLDELPRRFPGWIEGAQAGYDSALLRAVRPVDFRVAATGGTVTVAMRELPPPARVALPFEPPPPPGPTERRLDLARAQLLLESGRTIEAHSRLARLYRAAPQDRDVALKLAIAEERLGRLRRAASLYGKALSLAVDDPAAIREFARLNREVGRQVRLDQTVQWAGETETQYIVEFNAQAMAYAEDAVGLRVQNRLLEHDQLTRANGRSGAFSGSFQQADLTYVNENDLGLTTGHVLAATESLGAALRHEMHLDDLRVFAGAAVQAPAWDLVQGLVDGGTEDRLEAGLESPIGRFGVGSMQVSLSRYGVDGDGDVARSAGLIGNLRWRVPMAFDGLSLGYGFDAEYTLDVDQRLDDDGVEFRPFPLTTTEIHSIDMSWGEDLTDYVRFDATLGYAYDRYNAKGPLGVLQVLYEPLADLQAGLGAGYSRTSGRGGEEQDFIRLGGFLAVRF